MIGNPRTEYHHQEKRASTFYILYSAKKALFWSVAVFLVLPTLYNQCIFDPILPMPKSVWKRGRFSMAKLVKMLCQLGVNNALFQCYSHSLLLNEALCMFWSLNKHIVDNTAVFLLQRVPKVDFLLATSWVPSRWTLEKLVVVGRAHHSSTILVFRENQKTFLREKLFT